MKRRSAKIRRKKTTKRLLKYVTDTYKLQFILVFVCIFIVPSVSISLSLKFMLDDFILPLVGQSNPEFHKFYTNDRHTDASFAAVSCNIYLCKDDGIYRTTEVTKRVRGQYV